MQLETSSKSKVDLKIYFPLFIFSKYKNKTDAFSFLAIFSGPRNESEDVRQLPQYSFDHQNAESGLRL